MYVTLYGLKNCDSCRKALKDIEADGHQVAMIDVREDGMDPGLLAGLLAKHGDDTLLNRNSTTWRNLSEDEKEKKAYTLITNHPAVMKRPVLVADEGKSYIGWTAEIRAELKKG
ncbi:glutaredoxin family protein, arsenate reductase [SAR116 cluster alpha proteobacterium HIMB100]|nr:glutaredoxin family protein, arsenate reductase [SAR116 cluster alpha proteobacterium HIMB100]